MQSRVRFVGRDDWTSMDQGRHAIVIVRTRDGRSLESDVWHQAMSRSELEDKFRDLVEPRFGAARAGEITEMCNALPDAATIRSLMGAIGRKDEPREA
jgi:hypothetical protein